MDKPFSKAVFIDKDGTIIPDIPYNVEPSLITLNEGVLEGLLLLSQHHFLLIMISNQAGVAYGYFKVEALKGVQQKVDELLLPAGLSLDGYYFCPHHTKGIIQRYTFDCDCRKPKPGMILQAAKDFNVDLSSSYMIGDILNDVEAGKRAGCKGILLDNGNETEWILNEQRTPDKTVENFKEAAEWIVHQLPKHP